MSDAWQRLRLTARVPRPLLAAAAGLALAAAAGCSGDDGGDEPAPASAGTQAGSGVSEAKEIVSKAEQPLKFTFHGEPFAAAQARGKNVWFIAIALEVPVEQAWVAAMKEALSTVGAKVTPFDGKGQVAEMNRGIQQAIAAKADAIFLGAVPNQLVAASLANAEKAGIPVINGLGGDPGIPDDVPGVVAEVTFDYFEIGRQLGAWAVADAGGEPNALVIQSSDVDASEHQIRGITETIAELAPGSEVKVEDVPVAQWQTRLPTLTRTAVQRDPALEYLIPLYDGMTLSMLPALTQAGAAERVKIASLNATPAVLDNLEKGTAIKADVGAPNAWFGWAAADQVLRVMTGVSPVEDEEIPIRLFTEANIAEVDTAGDETTWYGDVDFKAEYKRLWGVTG